jgi:hypothetical protein
MPTTEAVVLKINQIYFRKSKGLEAQRAHKQVFNLLARSNPSKARDTLQWKIQNSRMNASRSSTALKTGRSLSSKPVTNWTSARAKVSKVFSTWE